MNYLPKQIAQIARINVETLRYYEKNGILPPPARGENGYRLYDEHTLERLETIQYAKACGLSLKETKEIFSVVENDTIDYSMIIEFLNIKTDEIDRRIGDLNKLKQLFEKIKNNIASNVKCPIKTTFEDLK